MVVVTPRVCLHEIGWSQVIKVTNLAVVKNQSAFTHNPTAPESLGEVAMPQL